MNPGAMAAPSMLEATTELAALRSRIDELEQSIRIDRHPAAPAQHGAVSSPTQFVLRALMEGTASETGDEFFRSLVKHLAKALNVRYAFVSEFTQVRTRVRTLAFWNGDGYLDNYEFDLAGTPCEPVLQGQMRHYAHGVQDAFPRVRDGLAALGVQSYLAIPMTDPSGEVLGHLSVMDIKPMPLADVDLWIFRTFGARAGAELARKQAALRLSESEQRLARMFESAMDAIVTIDERQRITLFNQAAAQVFRCDADSALGQPFERFMSDRFRVLLHNAVQEFERSGWAGHFLWAEGLTAFRCDGEAFPVDASLSPFEAQGRRHITLILRDTLIRTRAEVELQTLRRENALLQHVIQNQAGLPEVISASPATKKLLRDVGQVAQTDATVLITGETGTGKEVVARCIHHASGRRDKPMIKVNCAALSPSLIESELLGHEKGAFTGALTRKPGRFELAHQGTIFLDEIGELPLDLQAKLLRVLQEGEFERVGGTTTLKVNVRVIAATNRDLHKAAQEGQFRSDLYYRLSTFPIHVAPLRERREDIEAFVRHFVAKFAKRIGRPIHTVSRPVLDALTAYSWPGNVRELEHVIERAVILCAASRLELGDWVPRSAASPLRRGIKTLAALEREHILETLRQTHWKVSGIRGAAALLGLKATTLEARMKKFEIHRPR